VSKFKKRLTRTIALFVVFSSLIVNGASAASGSRYNLVADDVEPLGMTHVNNIISNLTNLGYVNTYNYLPLAATVFNNLPNSYVSVIHGHGNLGLISCKQTIKCLCITLNQIFCKTH
jgi:hypothetical protein